jgi:DNA mismatch repair ATPase MutL
MFASKACRGSVMIGKALSRTEMKKVQLGLWHSIDEPSLFFAAGSPYWITKSALGELCMITKMI